MTTFLILLTEPLRIGQESGTQVVTVHLIIPKDFSIDDKVL